jgi:hypothetical protein
VKYTWDKIVTTSLEFPSISTSEAYLKHPPVTTLIIGHRMNVEIPPDLHFQDRKIQNIEVWRSDLLPLIIGGQKIPSIPINAFGAQLQEFDQGNRDYTIFSSWIGTFVSGDAKEGSAEGTIREHIKAAVSTE